MLVDHGGNLPGSLRVAVRRVTKTIHLACDEHFVGVYGRYKPKIDGHAGRGSDSNFRFAARDCKQRDTVGRGAPHGPVQCKELENY